MKIGVMAWSDWFLRGVPPKTLRSGPSDQLRDNRRRHPRMPVDVSGHVFAGEAHVFSDRKLIGLP